MKDKTLLILDLATLSTLDADEIKDLEFPLGLKKHVEKKISAYKVRQQDIKLTANTSASQKQTSRPTPI